jgi:hypothetical protein
MYVNAVRCENCGQTINSYHPGICPDCQEMLREREHREKLVCHKHQHPQNYYWLKKSAGNEDIIGMPFSAMELHTGYYEWLHGAVLERQGHLYCYDGIHKNIVRY